MANAYNPLAGLTIADEHLERALKGQDFLVIDGGMGTMLQAAGLAQPGVVPDLLNLSNPADITAIHAQYVAAGAEVITTNTFGANARKLEGAASVAEVFAAAAKCARDAGARYVGGDLGPTGALLEPMGEMTFQQAYDLFAEQAVAAEAAGCDLILVETLSDLKEAKAALLAVRENCSLPVFVTLTYEEDGRTFLGTPPEVAAATLSSMGAHAVGTNCSLGPAEMAPIVSRLARASRVPVIVQPNAGLPRMEEGQTVYDITPEDFASAMEAIVDAGASIVGGCCGTNPRFTAQLAALTARRGEPAKRTLPTSFMLTSAQSAVELSQGSPQIAVIGERINPTGKRKLKEALRAGNLDYLVGEAVSQERFGANILDVNVGLPELDEPAMLEAAVQKLQATCTLPLVIDSSDVVAVERAVRTYVGRPLINSVNGKQESLHAVLPLAAKYGACVIGLTLDEDGIPPTADGRFAIARRIVETAESYGIPRHDVVIDCLTMAVATNQAEAPEILQAIRRCKQELGVRITLGVSNISFGLPQRNLMTSTFLAAAFGAGLDLPIINPNAERIRDAVTCYRVLSGQDKGAVAYIENRQQREDPYDKPAEVAADAAKVAQGVALILEATGVQVADGLAGVLAGRAAQQGMAPGAASHIGKTSGAASRIGKVPDAASPQDDIMVPENLADVAEQVIAMHQLILSGRKEPMTQATEELLAHHDSLDVIDGVLIPALDEVGMRFDRGQFFLPQLMASAEAVKAGFDVVKSHMGEANQADDGKKIAIATVKGDIHDIGKNIVKMLLENYGFIVVDLGKDVAPETVVNACREQGIKLVGLSALMTTTVRAMEQTIQLLHEELPEVKTFVGGAVLTPDYAQTMGADYYAKDAAESARIAEAFFG